MKIVKQLKIRTFLNATHATKRNKEEHPHTFEIICLVQDFESLDLNMITEQIENIITPLKNKYLNSVDAFQKKDPTLENIGDYLFNIITQKLIQKQISLVKFEISDSPLRTIIFKRSKNE